MRGLNLLRVVGVSLSLEAGDLVYVVLTVGIREVVEVIVELQVRRLADEVVRLVLTGVRTVERSALGQKILQSAGCQSEPGRVVASTHFSLEDRLLRTDLHGEGVRAGRGRLVLVLPLDEAGRGADDEEDGHQGDGDDEDQQGEVQGPSTSESVGFCKGRRFIKNCPESVASLRLLCHNMSRHESHCVSLCHDNQKFGLFRQQRRLALFLMSHSLAASGTCWVKLYLSHLALQGGQRLAERLPGICKNILSRNKHQTYLEQLSGRKA